MAAPRAFPNRPGQMRPFGAEEEDRRRVYERPVPAHLYRALETETLART